MWLSTPGSLYRASLPGVQAAVPIPPVSERDPSFFLCVTLLFLGDCISLPASAAVTSGRASLSLPPYLAAAWPPQLGSALVLFLRGTVITG